jgi:hypothetical protein
MHLGPVPGVEVRRTPPPAESHPGGRFTRTEPVERPAVHL